ncbi:hypothetical protein ACLOJK_004256 [Asimina triloba]
MKARTRIARVQPGPISFRFSEIFASPLPSHRAIASPSRPNRCLALPVVVAAVALVSGVYPCSSLPLPPSLSASLLSSVRRDLRRSRLASRRRRCCPSLRCLALFLPLASSLPLSLSPVQRPARPPSISPRQSPSPLLPSSPVSFPLPPSRFPPPSQPLSCPASGETSVDLASPSPRPAVALVSGGSRLAPPPPILPLPLSLFLPPSSSLPLSLSPVQLFLFLFLSPSSSLPLGLSPVQRVSDSMSPPLSSDSPSVGVILGY